MRSSEKNYFETLCKKLEANELVKKEKYDKAVKIETVDGKESGGETTDKADESAHYAMEIVENQEEMEVPVKLKAELKTKKPYECFVCHKTFRFKHNLKTHVESILQRHVGNKHSFTNDDTSNQHRPFECATCQKRFKTK
jgi:uncharacterized CHY-type Zn-finger protein